MPFAVVTQTGPESWKVRSVRATLPAIRKMPRRDLGAGVLEWVVELPKRDQGWKPGNDVSWRTWTRIVPDDEGATMPNGKRKRNPEVMRKPDASILSESNSLRMMRQLAQDILNGGTIKEAKDNAATIVVYCDSLLGQLASGVHANPSLVTFAAGNPSVVMSDHVQAIMYRHKKDGEFYIHTFGGRDIPIREHRGRQCIYFDELPAKTGVEMRSDKRVVVFRRPDGKPLADDF